MKKLLGKVLNGLLTPVYIVLALCFTVMIKVKDFTDSLQK